MSLGPSRQAFRAFYVPRFGFGYPS